MHTRRSFLRKSGAALLGAALVSKAAQTAVPEAAVQGAPDTQPPLVPPNGRPYQPVVTLNGWTLPWRMNNGWKEFHLVAEPVKRQLAQGMTAHLWGRQWPVARATIECVEGDKMRSSHETLPEPHDDPLAGLMLPNGRDGGGGLPNHTWLGKTFVYEFEMKHSGAACTTRTPTKWSRWRGLMDS